jgi:DNA replication protein DnaC
MSTTSEEIPQLLKNLRLYKTATTIEAELGAARKSSPSYSDFLAKLLRAEWLYQQERKLQARIKRAHFPEVWTLESFPFKNQPGVSRRQIQELAELEFIPKAMNIVFIGPSGVGKTGLASGLLLKALQNGYCALLCEGVDLLHIHRNFTSFLRSKGPKPRETVLSRESIAADIVGQFRVVLRDHSQFSAEVRVKCVSKRRKLAPTGHECLS